MGGQAALRRGIVMEGVQRALPPLLATLGLSFAQVREPLKELVASFDLLPTTITFSRDGWRIISLLLLKLLSRQQSEIESALQTEISSLHSILESLGQAYDFLDALCIELTSDVDPLLEKYEISFKRRSDEPYLAICELYTRYAKT